MFLGSNFLTVVSAILQTVSFNFKSKMAAEKSEKKRKCLYLGLCSSYNKDLEADFDIIKSRRPNGIKVRSIFDIIMYVNQYGGRETGSSYNVGPVAGKNLISNASTMFSGVAVSMQYRLYIASKYMCNSIWQPPYTIWTTSGLSAAIFNCCKCLIIVSAVGCY